MTITRRRAVRERIRYNRLRRMMAIGVSAEDISRAFTFNVQLACNACGNAIPGSVWVDSRGLLCARCALAGTSTTG